MENKEFSVFMLLIRIFTRVPCIPYHCALAWSQFRSQLSWYRSTSTPAKDVGTCWQCSTCVTATTMDKLFCRVGAVLVGTECIFSLHWSLLDTTSHENATMPKTVCAMLCTYKTEGSGEVVSDMQVEPRWKRVECKEWTGDSQQMDDVEGGGDWELQIVKRWRRLLLVRRRSRIAPLRWRTKVVDQQ